MAHAIVDFCKPATKPARVDRDIQGIVVINRDHANHRHLQISPDFRKAQSIVEYIPGKTENFCDDVLFMHRIKSNATIIAPHGAKLVNALFLGHNNCIIEVFPAGLLHRMYEHMLNNTVVIINDQQEELAPGQKSRLWSCSESWCRRSIRNNNNIVVTNEVLTAAIGTCGRLQGAYRQPKFFADAHSTRLQPSSPTAVLDFARTACFGEKSKYAGRAIVLAVQVYKGQVFSTPVRETAHSIRACHVLHSLNRTMSKLRQANWPVRNITFGVYLNDGCFHKGFETPTTLSYGVAPDRCPFAVPLPWLPTEHNYFFDHGRLDILNASQDITARYPWDRKHPLAVWRGTSSDSTNVSSLKAIRSRAVIKSMLFPHLLDIAITKPIEPQRLGKTVTGVADLKMGNKLGALAFDEMFAYKYVVDMGGVGCSYRLPSLLLGNSVVIQQSGWQYWFSHAFEDVILKARPDMEDLVPLVERLRANDKSARELADKASVLGRKLFTEDALKTYWSAMMEWLSTGRTPAEPPPNWLVSLSQLVANRDCHDPANIGSADPRAWYKAMLKSKTHDQRQRCVK